MKMASKILMMGLVMGALNLKAQGLSERDQRQIFILNCGNFVEVEQEFAEGKPITQEQAAELIAQRSSFYDVLKNGSSALQRILSQGSNADVGAFQALVVCGALDSIKAQIKKQGCLVLPVFEVIKDGPGIKSCEQFLAQIPH